MATAIDSPVIAPAPNHDRKIRELRVRNTFLSKLWATLLETITHPFARSVLILED